MKKLLSFFIVFAIIISSFGIVTFADGVIYGDVNSDHKVNNKDCAVLMQYLNGWRIEISFLNSDVNVDSKINNRDFALLLQFINDWEVVLGQKESSDIDTEQYRGTTVTFATTVLSDTNEAGPVINAFEKKYGIAVNEILVADNINEIASKIASGVYIDVAKCNGDFPAILGVLQPLTESKIDYNDPIWDQKMFEFSSINGQPYLCNSIGNMWSENACVLYSKSLLKQALCYTPEEYDHMGKWTWESFFEIAKHVDKIDGEIGYFSDINGCYISVEDMLGSAGCGVFDYENVVFSNGLRQDFHYEALKKLASYYRETNACSSATYDTIKTLFDGKVGIAIGNTQMLKKFEAASSKIPWSDIGFYTMPAYDTGYTVYNTNRVVGWGICRGSRNPVAAGIFLKYYLDCNNYDVGGSFITPDAEQFYFESTDFSYENYKPYFTYEYSLYNITGFWKYDWEELTILPEQYIDHYYSNVLSSVDTACYYLNSFIQKNLF